MKHKTLKQYIYKMYLPRLIIPIILFIVLVGLSLFNPLKNHISPDKITDLSSIDSMRSSKHINVRVEVDKLYYTGVDYTVNGIIRARFYYALAEGHCYFFLICKDKIPSKYSVINNPDVYAHLTHNDNMYKTIIASMSDELKISEQQMSAITSPVFINQYDYVHSYETFFIYVLNIFTAMVAIDIIFIAIVFFNPHISLPFFKMRKYGKLKKLFELAEKELDSCLAIYGEKIFITDTFFIGITIASNLEIVPLENIVWIYKSNEFTSHHGQPKMNCSLCIITDNKQLIKIPHLPKEISEEIINKIQKLYPNVMDGND